MGVPVNPYSSNMAHHSYDYYNPQTWPPYYVPEPWRTTAVPHHFPEHHYPLEHVRHTLGRTLSTLGHAVVHPWEDGPPVYSPRTDIQESEMNYYVDIELPGVEGRDKITLKWISSRTLLLEARVKRPLTGEEDAGGDVKGKATESASDPKPAEATSDDGGELTRILSTNEQEQAREGGREGKSAGSPKTHPKVFLTVKERHVGMFARAFSFPTAVDHAMLEAHLEHGLLRLKVPKVMDEPVKEEHKMPEIKEGVTKDANITGWPGLGQF